MCTRFFMYSQSQELDEISSEMMLSNLTKRFLESGSSVLTSGEIRPTDVVPVIAPDKEGARAVFPMRWGFRIPGRSLIVNARAETAAVRPTFREPWKEHRCAVPASWYFEWDHIPLQNGKTRTGDKYAIHPRNESLTWLCGLYRIEDGLPVFAVLTREPSEEVSRIHDRMPLILPGSLIDDWISPSNQAEDLLQYALTDMVMEKAGGSG